MGRGARERLLRLRAVSRAGRTPEREMPKTAHLTVITSTPLPPAPGAAETPGPRQDGENLLQQQRCLGRGSQRPQVLAPGAGVSRALGSGLVAAGGPNSPSLRAGARPPGVPGARRALPPGPAPRASSRPPPSTRRSAPFTPG